MHVVDAYNLVQSFQYALVLCLIVFVGTSQLNQLLPAHAFSRKDAYPLLLGHFGYVLYVVCHRQDLLNQLTFFLNLSVYLHWQR